MTVHTESRFIPAPREIVFDMVADVEHYPEFLPLWRQARVIRTTDDGYETEQLIGLGFIHERFRTLTVLDRPSEIDILSHDTLFRRFRIHWTFTERAPGCTAQIRLEWEVRSRRLQIAINAVLPGVARMMVGAFETRARRRVRAPGEKPVETAATPPKRRRPPQRGKS